MSFFQNFISRLVPAVKAEDEELVDPLQVRRDECKKQAKCIAFKEKLDTCNDRVNSRTKTEETCLEEIIDYVSCVDHCAAHGLMKLLK